jgi:hypothetical protein
MDRMETKLRVFLVFSLIDRRSLLSLEPLNPEGGDSIHARYTEAIAISVEKP